MNVLQHTRNERNPCLKQNRPDRSYRDTLLNAFTITINKCCSALYILGYSSKVFPSPETKPKKTKKCTQPTATLSLRFRNLNEVMIFQWTLHSICRVKSFPWFREFTWYTWLSRWASNGLRGRFHSKACRQDQHLMHPPLVNRSISHKKVLL